MGKNKKKKDKKLKNGAVSVADLEAEIQRLREENEGLRARLEQIAELSSDLPASGDDDDVMPLSYDDEEDPAVPDVNPS